MNLFGILSYKKTSMEILEFKRIISKMWSLPEELAINYSRKSDKQSLKIVQ
jgi:hypothetical protein